MRSAIGLLVSALTVGVPNLNVAIIDNVSDLPQAAEDDALTSEPETATVSWRTFFPEEDSVSPSRFERETPIELRSSFFLGKDQSRLPMEDGGQARRFALQASDVCRTLAEAAQEQDLPLAFFTNLIWQESRFSPTSVSNAGAQGIAQFMPEAASDVGLRDPFNPFEAIPASAKLLRSLREQFGNLGLAAAAYNAGAGRVSHWIAKGGKLPRETRNYVMIITGRPADHWRGRKTVKFDYGMTRRIPCRSVGGAYAEVEDAHPLPPDPPTAAQTSRKRVVVARRHTHSTRVARAARHTPVKLSSASGS